MARPKSNKPKRGFCEGYKTYNPETEGYGDASQWKQAFNQRMGYDEAKNILSEEDPYTILEISHGVSLGEIKSQYRKLAMKWHPDKNPQEDTTNKMQKIIAAYTIILKTKFS